MAETLAADSPNPQSLAETLAAEVGRRIKSARKRVFVSAGEMGAALGYTSATTANNWEMGKRLPDLVDLYRIAALCGLRVTDLIPHTAAGDDYVRLIDAIDQLSLGGVRRVRALVEEELRQQSSRVIDRREVSDTHEALMTTVHHTPPHVVPLSPAQRIRRRRAQSKPKPKPKL
jgi:transcriptional regulator with XRE-family HTH domain